MRKGYNELYESVNRWRQILSEGQDFKEKKDDGVEAVPYTQQDELMSSITQTAKSQFGADFSKLKTPMLYYPKDGDVTLSGEIGGLNDAKFQYRYKDNAGGCYVWISPINLTDDTLRTLSVILGVYKNWKKSLSEAEDIKPMSMANSEPQGTQQPQQPQVPGDDMPS